MSIPYESPAIGQAYIELGPDIVVAILTTLEAGWTEAISTTKVRSSEGEVEMTERLRDGMRSVLNRGDLAWGKQFIVAPGTETRSTRATIVPDGRTDIPIYVIEVFLNYAEHDPHAIIECKRLAGDDTHLCREYVVEGVDRFRTGKYGSNHAVGFMAGYILKGNERSAASGVNAYLDRVRRSEERLVASPTMVTDAFWQSSHTRTIEPPEFDLYHAFFAFPNRPN